MIPAPIAAAEPARVEKRESWQVRDPGAILVREWDGEVVVYNANAASTHLLSPAAGVIFMVLLDAARPTAVGTLAALVFDDSSSRPAEPAPACSAGRDSAAEGCGEIDGAAGGDLSGLRTVLDDLDRIGLIEAVRA